MPQRRDTQVRAPCHYYSNLKKHKTVKVHISLEIPLSTKYSSLMYMKKCLLTFWYSLTELALFFSHCLVSSLFITSYLHLFQKYSGTRKISMFFHFFLHLIQRAEHEVFQQSNYLVTYLPAFAFKLCLCISIDGNNVESVKLFAVKFQYLEGKTRLPIGRKFGLFGTYKHKKLWDF